MALNLYLDDNGGYFPIASDGSSSNLWTKKLTPYLKQRGDLATSTTLRASTIRVTVSR